MLKAMLRAARLVPRGTESSQSPRRTGGAPGRWAEAGWLALLTAVGCAHPGVRTAPPPEKTVAAPPAAPAAESARVPLARNVPGAFDFYVLSLSWSPQHCASRRRPGRPDDPQCGGSQMFGFVVHGLWPQYVTGYPESCAAPQAVAPELVQRMLRIMPSPRLIQHEWDKHGTCSGLPAEQYFGHTEDLMASVQIPPSYRAPAEPLRTTLASLRAELLAQNPAFPRDGSSVAVVCQGEFLQELRLCYDKEFHPRACGGTVADSCPRPELSVRPVLLRQQESR